MIGKVAIITGATAGIGEATAKRFAREGIRVVLAGRREALGQRLVESIRAEGGEGTFVAADMLSEDDVRRVVDTAVNHYGRLDYAVNNAGIPGEVEPLHELSRNNWDNVIGVNLTGVFLCLKYQVAAMLESGAREPGGAAIVNVASYTALHRSPARPTRRQSTAWWASPGRRPWSTCSATSASMRCARALPGPSYCRS